MIRNIRFSVYVVVVVLTLLPTLSAFYAIRGIVDSAVMVGINPKLEQQLSQSGVSLKKLAKIDTANASKYRIEFEELQEVRRTYNLILEYIPLLKKSYFEVFGAILGVALFAAFCLAWWLNRKIIRSYEFAILNIDKTQKRNLYLENREAWRVVAQKFVHEVKNPLTPIKVMVGRLSSRYQTLHQSVSTEFLSILAETQEMVAGETDKVTRWVDAFSNYARLPDVNAKPEIAGNIVADFLQSYSEYWPNMFFEFEKPVDRQVIHCDRTLIRQVFFNLAKNSSEALNGSHGTIRITCVAEEEFLKIIFKDSGPGIPVSFREKLFQPYPRIDTSPKGMGLGLAICKKIMVEHDGDIRLGESDAGCAFELLLPLHKDRM